MHERACKQHKEAARNLTGITLAGACFRCKAKKKMQRAPPATLLGHERDKVSAFGREHVAAWQDERPEVRVHALICSLHALRKGLALVRVAQQTVRVGEERARDLRSNQTG